MKILIIEDNADALNRLLNTVMIEEDYHQNELTITNQLKVADALLESICFDIIFLDCMLPDGIATNYLEGWKEQGKLKDTHVVAISSSDENNLKMLDSGAHDSIPKSNGFENWVRNTIERVKNER